MLSIYVLDAFSPISDCEPISRTGLFYLGVSFLALHHVFLFLALYRNRGILIHNPIL